ncbi:GNAT family N-acetyltransferase [Streptomyces sp. NPDC088354]|uniref:GNAT family N-acetyltransferase n=1 Tax=unclassified Streptomyces TaxID=2593676 RepID=UPI0029A1D966|nr:GNAT family N-acetyltransferase [Streptomyces sp. MI02-7b]MDX3073952.1 GNAT family N-acetyltransferase [Streptomyces sp. MI02-7b]
MTELLARLERYYDAVPRAAARAEDFGPLTLFVREGLGWPYYARPTRDADGRVGRADVDRVRERQRRLGVPECFEWVAETTPALREAAEASGLLVHAHPLMVLDPGAAGAVAAPVDGVDVRVLAPGDPAFASALTVPHLAFAHPGTAIGPAGTSELDVARVLHAAPAALAAAEARVRDGLTVHAAAVDGTTALCAGQYNPVGEVCEIVGVGTLPSARRRGLALAVTSALVRHARARGLGTVFLSAGDEDVARIYARVGFRRVGTALIAEPPAG